MSTIKKDSDPRNSDVSAQFPISLRTISSFSINDTGDEDASYEKRLTKIQASDRSALKCDLILTWHILR